MLVFKLRQLINSMPALEARPLPRDAVAWLAQCSVVVAQTYEGRISPDPSSFNFEMDSLAGPYVHSPAKLINILHRALAIAETDAPMPSGGFITKGATFDAYQVVGEVLRQAKSDVLIIDPYMDERVLTDYAKLAPEGVSMRLLTDREYTKPDALLPGMTRWKAQFEGKRPLEIKFTKRKMLHDRDLVVDRTGVWYMTQSLKDFANRSHGSIAEVDPQQAAMKIDTYELLWTDATPIQQPS